MQTQQSGAKRVGKKGVKKVAKKTQKRRDVPRRAENKSAGAPTARGMTIPASRSNRLKTPARGTTVGVAAHGYQKTCALTREMVRRDNTAFEEAMRRLGGVTSREAVAAM